MQTTTYTPQHYKDAARFNLWLAKMSRLYGRTDEADGHMKLADLYIKQELNRERAA